MKLYTNVGCALNVVGDATKRNEDILISFPSGNSVRAYVREVHTTHAEVWIMKDDNAVDTALLYFTPEACPDRKATT